MTKKMDQFLRHWIIGERIFPVSTSVQVLFQISIVLVDELAESLFCGFALAFDRLAKSKYIRFQLEFFRLHLKDFLLVVVVVILVA